MPTQADKHEQGIEPNTRSVNPVLSVILITPDRFETLSTTIGYLRHQTIHDRLEIVIVAPSAEGLALKRDELESFAGVQIVSVGQIHSVGASYAAGVRRASAPVVVFGEDHSFPRSDWAERLVQAHQQGWAAVGPQVYNQNPGSAIARSDFLIAYGPWSDPVTTGEVEHLPGHNSSYKRSLLLEYGADLDNMLEAESVLHWDLRRKGHRLYLETAAKTSHMNFGRFSSWALAQFQAGLVFAGFRAYNERWPLSRRLLFALAAPLIPVVRLRRILPRLRRTGSMRILLPITAFGLTLDGLGQMIGYAAGKTVAAHRFTYFEFKRIQHQGKRNRSPRTSANYA